MTPESIFTSMNGGKKPRRQMEANMKYIYGKNDWSSMSRGQENCYLLANGLGGYSSLTMLGSSVRNDNALLMACTKAPNYRYHMITRMEEIIRIGQKEMFLSSQEYINYTKNQQGYEYLQQFSYEQFPKWIYQVEGIEIKKTIVLKYAENTVGIRYEFDNRMKEAVPFTVIPQLQFVIKGESIQNNQDFQIGKESILSNGLELFYKVNAEVKVYPTQYQEDLFYSYDARDGREAVGKTAHNHHLCITIPSKQEMICDLIYSMNPIVELTFDQMKQQEEDRQKSLAIQSGLSGEIALQLVKSADQFIVERESTEGKSIMAGYPFFADWGRDTMIAMVGCCISTRRFEDAKSIFRTFMKYCKNGLMPNMFPEGGNEPIYNTVDASLLFVGAVYEYYQESEDVAFVKEALPIMVDIMEWYQKGTDFHIRMCSDGLIEAGSGLEQVTWMDVRYGDILPTPRHGKPVEINAYWYNALRIMGYFSRLSGEEVMQYDELAALVKTSFQEQFWNEDQRCLKDIVSGEPADGQIRCNQIWAISLPFTMLDREKEIMVVDQVFEKLYTPYGLRTLNIEDKNFKTNYGGSHYARDMAYHQGTVWPFPMGGYYLAYLKVHDYSEKAVLKVKDQLNSLQACMREGCIGQIAEIYDGKNQTISQGCFAQAWSVSEILRVFVKLEQLEQKK